MQEGMFLGYKVNVEGLKVCPDKADAVLSLLSLGCLKDVQKLNGKLASLNRFLSKSAEKSLPFFKTLKKCTKKRDFQWTQEAEVAFKQMKKLIAELPMLTAPVYFVSRALRGPEINYTPWKNWPRTSIKGQILADFIIERPDEESPDELMAELEELPEP
ncbi:hypothetical protein Tco_0051641 [Tanacetum coccineum]